MRTRFTAAIVGSLLLGAMASQALAQAAPGKPAPGVITPEMRGRTGDTVIQRELDLRRLNDDPQVARQLHENASTIAKCIVRRGADRAAGYLGGALAGDPDYGRLGDAMTGRMRNCADANTSATAIAISGALAEELVRAQAPQFADRAPAVNEDDARKFFGDLTGPVTLDNIAGCLAVYSPGLAYKVLGTEVGSSEETAALAEVFRQTPECRMSAPPSGIPPLYARGALATALYEWTHQKA